MFALLAQLSDLFALVHEVLGASCSDFFFVFDPGKNFADLLWEFYQINQRFVTVNANEILAQVPENMNKHGPRNLQSLIPGVVSYIFCANFFIFSIAAPLFTSEPTDSDSSLYFGLKASWSENSSLNK